MQAQTAQQVQPAEVKPVATSGEPQAAQPPAKKSLWWLWLIIIIVVVGLGIGIYFWLG